MAKYFHIIDKLEWAEAKKGSEYKPESLSDVGFVHLSMPDEILYVANSFFKNP